ncbi:MAG: MTH1187 family thiamine-binding protein [Planctomycetia bacterium]|nr:MTH1187 family thiamine-binding protein [Planctomycetia bacterium]
MVLMEFSMTPLGEGVSVSAYVARCVEIVERSGLDYRLHAMGTVAEGELDALLALLQQCFTELAADCERITCSAKFDYRRGPAGRLDAKVQSVEEKLGRKLKC